jgi:hypothetical protein
VAEQPAEVLEIGTFMGHTTAQMAEAIPNSIIHTVDLPDDFRVSDQGEFPKDDFHLIGRREVVREFKSLPIASHIRQHLAIRRCGTSTKPATRPSFSSMARTPTSMRATILRPALDCVEDAAFFSGTTAIRCIPASSA